MKSVQSIVCSILNQALFQTYEKYDYSDIDDETWRKVYTEFISHAIISLPAEILEQLPIPTDIMTEWEKNAFFGSAQFFRMAEEQKELLELLKQEEIPFVILKGMAAAITYPFPLLRCFGDIDFIVPPIYLDKAKSVLLSHDYIINDDNAEKEDNRHIGFIKNEIHFELHRYFAGQDDDEQNLLDTMIFENMDKCETGIIEQYTFPILPTIPNGLVLLKHIEQHLQTGLGLRQILDWLLFVKTNLTDQTWEHFRKQSDRIGLTGLAIHVTRMGQLFLGFPKADYTWCKPADEKICANLMEYIFQSGNFGHKKVDTSIMIGAMTRMRQDFFHALQSSGEKTGNYWKNIHF